MDDFIKSKLSDRAQIIGNLDNLIKHGNELKKSASQLSLFGSSNEAKPQMVEIEHVDFNKMIEGEKNALGICLTYDIFDKHVLIRKRFCNHTIRTFNELTESRPTGIMLIASVSDIDYRKSLSGNNYAKITLQDHNSSCIVYLWGQIYQSYISRVFKNRIYLVELGYNKDTDSAFIINIKSIEDIQPQDHISSIILYIDEMKNVVKVRGYIFDNMLRFEQSFYNLVFNYKGDEIHPKYKISFTEQDYLYLKELITNIGVVK